MDIPNLYEEKNIPIFLYSLLAIRKHNYCLESIDIVYMILEKICSYDKCVREFETICYTTKDHDNYAVLLARIFSEISVESKDVRQKFSELITLFLSMCIIQDKKFDTFPTVTQWMLETPNKNNDTFCELLKPFMEEFENINPALALTIKEIGNR
jgi:hypothetical protein